MQASGVFGAPKRSRFCSAEQERWFVIVQTANVGLRANRTREHSGLANFTEPEVIVSRLRVENCGVSRERFSVARKTHFCAGF
jgi:hypothetical protein